MTQQERISAYRALYNKYENIVHRQRGYSQFTIDFIQNHEADFADYEEEQPDFVDTHAASMLYQIDNILEIVKEGKDKELFQQMNDEFEIIEKSSTKLKEEE